MSLEVNFRRCIFLICFLGIALAGGAVVLADKGEKGNDDNDKGAPIRWDIIHATFGAVLIVDAGGQASVMAEDHSKITFTGHGTFQTNSDKHHPRFSKGSPQRRGSWTTGSLWRRFLLLTGTARFFTFFKKVLRMMIEGGTRFPRPTPGGGDSTSPVGGVSMAEA